MSNLIHGQHQQKIDGVTITLDVWATTETDTFEYPIDRAEHRVTVPGEIVKLEILVEGETSDLPVYHSIYTDETEIGVLLTFWLGDDYESRIDYED